MFSADTTTTGLITQYMLATIKNREKMLHQRLVESMDAGPQIQGTECIVIIFDQ